MTQLARQVYHYHKRWWFAIVELGRLGQVIDWIKRRRCRNMKDAYMQAASALEEERRKRRGDT